MATSFDTLQRSDTVRYGICGGIWIMTLFAKPTAADMNLARAALKSTLVRHPDGFPTLTWILPEAGFSMDADARQAAATVTREFNASILAMATLIEGEGFQAATVRAIIAGLDLMARASAPKKTFADLRAAVVWSVSLRPRRDRDAGEVDGIVESLAAMRRELTGGR